MIGSPARGAVRAVRVGLLGTASMTLATTAHLMGGGPLPPVGVLIVSGLLVGLVAVTATARRCRLRVLVALLAVEQVLLHWLFAAAAAMGGCDAGPLAAGHHGGTLGAMGCAAGRATQWVVRHWEWPHRRCGWPTRPRCSGRPGCWRVARPGCGGWPIGSSGRRRRNRPVDRSGATRCGIRPSGSSTCRLRQYHRPLHGVRLFSRRASRRVVSIDGLLRGTRARTGLRCRRRG